MKNLIIEVGKFYKTREGCKVRIYALDGGLCGTMIHGAFLTITSTNKIWNPARWYKNGKNYLDGDFALDIVSEYTEPHPAESWEVDKKILVSSNGIDWFKRHFAKYENGQFYVWNIGGTSWTAQDNNCFEWKFAKPAEEE